MKLLSLLFLALVSLTLNADIKEISDNNLLTIETPSFKDRKIFKGELSNGLKVMIISDPSLDQSGAAVAVGVGSMDEPSHSLGLAHFLEHMLFLGTEKYPVENSYFNFIESHGGKANAFTADDRTVYVFSITNDAFLEALDQFAQFFVSPLFSPSGASREMHAVDQEYNLYLENDTWRLLYIIKSLSRPESPLSRFSIGNLDTLSKVSEPELKNWWQSHYSANEMTLIVYSPLSLEELKKAVDTDFSPILTPQVAFENLSESSFLTEYEGKKIIVEPLHNSRRLWTVFDIPADLYEPARLVGDALSDQSSQSLVRILQEKGLVESINVDISRSRSRLLFMVEIDLTEQGKNKSEEVIKALFGTLNVWRQSGLSKGYFDQLQASKKLLYTYQPQTDVFSRVMDDATNVIDEPLITYPMNTVLLKEYNPDSLHQLLAQLVPEHAFFLLQATGVVDAGRNLEKEEWLGVNYQVSDFPAGFIQSLSSEKSAVVLQETNPWLATNFELVSCPPAQAPQKVIDRKGCLFYASCDHQFKVPQAAAVLHLRPSKAWSLGAKSAVLRDFLVNAVQYKIQPDAFLAAAAGIDTSFKETEGQIQITVYGFNEKLLAWLELVAKAIYDTSLTESEFLMIKNALLQHYQNTASSDPYKQGLDLAQQILFKPFISSEKKARVLKGLSFDTFKEQRQKMMKRLFVEGIVYGNILPEQVSGFCDRLKELLQVDPLERTDLFEPSFFLEKKGPLLLEKPINQLGNFAALMVQDGCFTLSKESSLAILTRALHEPFFSALRTEQQTGYVVSNTQLVRPGDLVECLFAQSTTHDPQELLYRFELFIEQFLQAGVPQDRFQSIKDSLVAELKAPEKSPLEKALRLDKMAFLLKGDFAWHDKRIQAAEALSFQTFQDFTSVFLARNNPSRIGLLLKGRSQGERSLRYNPMKTLEELHKSGEFATFEQNQCSP